jgi:hypothetical protein
MAGNQSLDHTQIESAFFAIVNIHRWEDNVTTRTIEVASNYRGPALVHNIAICGKRLKGRARLDVHGHTGPPTLVALGAKSQDSDCESLLEVSIKKFQRDMHIRTVGSTPKKGDSLHMLCGLVGVTASHNCWIPAAIRIGHV